MKKKVTIELISCASNVHADRSVICYISSSSDVMSDCRMQDVLSSDRRRHGLTLRVRDYYASERLYLLRCLKHLLSFYSEQHHPYSVSTATEASRMIEFLRSAQHKTCHFGDIFPIRFLGLVLKTEADVVVTKSKKTDDISRHHFFYSSAAYSHSLAVFAMLLVGQPEEHIVTNANVACGIFEMGLSLSDSFWKVLVVVFTLKVSFRWRGFHNSSWSFYVCFRSRLQNLLIRSMTTRSLLTRYTAVIKCFSYFLRCVVSCYPTCMLWLHF